jgi:hypothetical protein
MKNLKFGYIELTQYGCLVPVNVRGIMNVKEGAYRPSCKPEDEEKAWVTFLDSSTAMFDEPWYEVQKLILERVS